MDANLNQIENDLKTELKNASMGEENAQTNKVQNQEKIFPIEFASTFTGLANGLLCARFQSMVDAKEHDRIERFFEPKPQQIAAIDSAMNYTAKIYVPQMNEKTLALVMCMSVLAMYGGMYVQGMKLIAPMKKAE